MHAVSKRKPLIPFFGSYLRNTFHIRKALRKASPDNLRRILSKHSIKDTLKEDQRE
jgi:hypothetical protein